MAIGAKSYGSVAEVAAKAKRWTASGSFSTSTNPTTAEVEGDIDKVSALVNALLAEQGFEIPVSQADAELVLDLFVINLVVALCDAANRLGRLYTLAQKKGIVQVITEDVEAFIASHSEGFEQLGATRDRHLSQGLDYLSADDAGDDIEPIFDRKFMRQTIIDWDTG